MTPSAGPYHVDLSDEVKAQLRGLAVEAKAGGRLQKFLDAANCILQELTHDPHRFGESWVRLTHSALAYRRGFARPLHVQFAIHDAGRTVFVRRFTLLR